MALQQDEILVRRRMSWEDYLALPERPRAEWVDGEAVIMMSLARRPHGRAVSGLIVALTTALPGLEVVTEVGVALPRNRLRVPDVMVLRPGPDEPWVTDVPVVVAEVLSPSTRREDLLRKSGEYAEAGIDQYWVVDPEARALEVLVNEGGRWETLLTLDDLHPAGEVCVGDHGVVPLSLSAILAD